MTCCFRDHKVQLRTFIYYYAGCHLAVSSWHPPKLKAILWAHGVGWAATPRDCAHSDHCPLCPPWEGWGGHIQSTCQTCRQRGHHMVLNAPKCVFADLWKCQPSFKGRQAACLELPLYPFLSLCGREGPLKGWVIDWFELALFMSAACPDSDDCSGSLEMVFDLTFRFPLFTSASSYF